MDRITLFVCTQYRYLSIIEEYSYHYGYNIIWLWVQFILEKNILSTRYLPKLKINYFCYYCIMVTITLFFIDTKILSCINIILNNQQ